MQLWQKWAVAGLLVSAAGVAEEYEFVDDGGSGVGFSLYLGPKHNEPYYYYYHPYDDYYYFGPSEGRCVYYYDDGVWIYHCE